MPRLEYPVVAMLATCRVIVAGGARHTRRRCGRRWSSNRRESRGGGFLRLQRCQSRLHHAFREIPREHTRIVIDLRRNGGLRRLLLLWRPRGRGGHCRRSARRGPTARSFRAFLLLREGAALREGASQALHDGRVQVYWLEGEPTKKRRWLSDEEIDWQSTADSPSVILAY